MERDETNTRDERRASKKHKKSCLTSHKNFITFSSCGHGTPENKVDADTFTCVKVR